MTTVDADKAAAEAAKMAAYVAAKTAANKALSDYETAVTKGLHKVEVSTGDRLATAMTSIHAAITAGVRVDDLTSPTTNKDTVAKYAIAGSMLGKGGAMPELGTAPTVAHLLRTTVENCIRKGLGLKRIREIIAPTATVGAAYGALVDAIAAAPVKQQQTVTAATVTTAAPAAPAAPTVQTIAGLLAAAAGTIRKAADLAANGVTTADRDAAQALIDVLESIVTAA